MLIKFSKKSLPSKKDILEYEELLPKLEAMQYLSFMISLNILINHDLSRPKVEYIIDVDSKTLTLDLENKTFLIKSNIEKLELPKELTLKII